MKVLQVKEYNKEALTRYHEAVKNWDNTKGGFPFVGMYTYSTPEGNFRKNGYVVYKDNSSHFRLTKAQVKQEFNITIA